MNLVTCAHRDRPRYAKGLCWPCYATKLWKGQSIEKDGAWAAYRKGRAPRPSRSMQVTPHTSQDACPLTERHPRAAPRDRVSTR